MYGLPYIRTYLAETYNFVSGYKPPSSYKAVTDATNAVFRGLGNNNDVSMG